MAIHFKCPSCENDITVRYLGVGEEFECRNCHQRGLIPESGEEVAISDGDYFGQTSTSSSNNDSTKEQTNNSKSRFPAIRIVSDLTKIGAWVIFAVALIIGIMAISNRALFAGIGWIAGGMAYLVMNLAFAELLIVLLAIEENTRKASDE